MPDEFQTSKVETRNIGQTVDELLNYAKSTRRNYERRWYDNNFFDDGYHFRYYSRTTDKIVDLSDKSNMYNPTRAIPKASRQIRGVANLLIMNDPTPIVYPEKLNVGAFTPEEMQAAREDVRRVAQLSGHWVEEGFKKQDISEKLALMIILAAKHGISYMQIWPDAVKEDIKTKVYDAFDIYLKGDLQEIYESPFLIKGVPKTIAEIKANELYDPAQLEKLTPDNKLASSEIKEAYARAKEGMPTNPDLVASIILKEAFLKEYVNKNNRDMVKKAGIARNEGDSVIRHAFVAGDVWLYDEYLDIPEYPFVDYRFEPGPIYQVPLIERFIPANKSLDVISSRVERYVNTMVTGFWLKKQGEQWKPTNVPGGQVIEYMTTPPTQGQISPIPGFVFNFMELLNQFIEEQGVTVSTLSKIPKGVRANSAIESLKESEYASLAIASRRLKSTVKKIAEKFLMIADDYFVSPQTYEFLEKGEPQYFDVIGKNAMQKRKDLNVPVDGQTIPLSGDYRVEIEVEAGLGYTKQGQRETMLKLISEFLLPLVDKQMIPPQAVKVMIERTFETFQFGATAEFMDALDKFQGQGNMTEDQLQAMKVAIAEVLKDLQGSEIFPDQQARIDEGKMATAEALKDTGMIDGKPQDPLIEKEIEAKEQEMQHKQEEHELKMQKLRQGIEVVDEKTSVDLNIKKAEAFQDMDIKEEESEAKIEVQKKEAQNSVQK